MPYLSWISDKSLIEAVAFILEKTIEAQKMAKINFAKNVIDPFSALFQIAGFGLDFNNWVLSEQTRQSQKTMQNAIGNFHQQILGSIEGWENLKSGNVMDLISKENKILAEIKNKYNTVKGSSLAELYREIESEIMPKHSMYNGYTGFYVSIIPKKPERYNKLFVPSDRKTGKRLPENDKIRMIDGASFYSMVTGVDNALEQLFDILYVVIEDSIKLKFSDSDKISLKEFFKSAFG